MVTLYKLKYGYTKTTYSVITWVKLNKYVDIWTWVKNEWTIFFNSNPNQIEGVNIYSSKIWSYFNLQIFDSISHITHVHMSGFCCKFFKL